MQITRASLVKLGSVAGVAAVYGTCHYFKVEELAGLLGAGLAVVGHAWVGHLLTEFTKDVAERFGEEGPRAAQNRDLHRLIGETIAQILEREAKRAPSVHGTRYLMEAAKRFRGEAWTGQLPTPRMVDRSDHTHAPGGKCSRSDPH